MNAWARWLARLLKGRKRREVGKPKARRVPAYRRANGTDELRRIH